MKEYLSLAAASSLAVINYLSELSPPLGGLTYAIAAALGVYGVAKLLFSQESAPPSPSSKKPILKKRIDSKSPSLPSEKSIFPKRVTWGIELSTCFRKSDPPIHIHHEDTRRSISSLSFPFQKEMILVFKSEEKLRAEISELRVSDFD